MSEVGLFLSELRNGHNENQDMMALKLNINVNTLIALEQLHVLPQTIKESLIEKYDLLLAGEKLYFNCACKDCNMPVPIGNLFCTEHNPTFIGATRSYKELSLLDERYAQLISLPKVLLRKRVNKQLSY